MSTDVVFPFLNFLLFFILLVWFSRKPVRAIWDRKRLAVQIQLDAAALAKAEAQTAAQELQEKAQGLAGDLQQLRDEIQAHSRQFAEEVAQRGNWLSQKMIQETQEVMEAEVMRAQTQIQTELLSLVETAVVEQIREHQGNEQQKKIFTQEMQTVTRLFAEGKL